MSMNDRQRSIGPQDFAPASLRFAAFLAGSLTLAVALANAGHADTTQGHDHGGGHAHASHGHDDHAGHGDDGHAAHGDDDHDAHGHDDHAGHGDDGHAAHAAHGDDGHAAHGDDGHAAHGDDGHAAHGGGHGWQAPQAWVERDSPLEPDADTLAYGQQVFQRYCSACHGLGGAGDGPAATVAGFDPPPTDLTRHGAAHGAGEYAWLVKEGGHTSAMPRYQGKLDEEAIWSVVLYIRHHLADPQADHAH